MKKLLSWVMVICILLFFMMSFSACQSLKISNLKANDHFKKGNGFYTKEQYKKAVEEYEKALEYNPDLKIAYFYLGTACSRSYKAGIAPPEQNEEYNEKFQQNEQLKSQIEEHNAFIKDFIDSNPEFAIKLKENQELREKIKETEKQMSFVRGYEGYIELLSDNDEYHRRVKVNDEYVKRLREEMAATEKGAEEEKSISEEEFPEDDVTPSDEIENLLKEKEDLISKIEDNKVAIANFEKNEEFQELARIKQNYLDMIKQNGDFLKSFEGYDEYRSKVETRDNYIKITKTNENYIDRVVENETFRKKAIKYLEKAREAQPDNERVVLALSEMFDKMGDFEEAEKYYLIMLDKAADNPKAYYTLAEFYKKNAQFDKAESMYEKRVALNPNDPEGYLFYINFLQDLRKWDKAIKFHKERINIIINPDVLSIQKEINELEQLVERIKSINQYIDNVQKNKSIPNDQKEQLLAEKREQLQELGTPEGINAQIEVKTEEINKIVKLGDEEIKNLPEEKLNMLADAYYRLGVLFWNKSYQTPRDLMGPKERTEVVDEGFNYLDKAIQMKPDFPDPWAYKKLLYLQKIVADPLKADLYNKKGDEMGAKFTELRKKQLERDAYLRQLEQTEAE